MRRAIARHGWVWGSALALSAVLFVACGVGGSSSGSASSVPTASTGSSGSSTSSTAALPSTTVAIPDAVLSAADFVNVNRMTRVGDHFIANVRGQLPQALTVARSAKGGVYPVGTVLQLVPTEAMVKRTKGFSPSTDDWEFFSLDISASGTKILSRGGAQVLNRFGGSCASCHSAAQPQFDFVCGTTHGCAPLPIGPAVIASLQKSDPRPKG